MNTKHLIALSATIALLMINILYWNIRTASCELQKQELEIQMLENQKKAIIQLNP